MVVLGHFNGSDFSNSVHTCRHKLLVVLERTLDVSEALLTGQAAYLSLLELVWSKVRQNYDEEHTAT